MAWTVKGAEKNEASNTLAIIQSPCRAFTDSGYDAHMTIAEKLLGMDPVIHAST
jgi:hypothetical protein